MAVRFKRNGITKRAVKAIENRRLQKEILNLFGLNIQDFFQ